MAAPILLTTYPADDDVGIPIAESLYLIFDRGVDLDTVKKHVVLYGADFDKSSGPDSAQWINPEDGSNPFYLKSPGFKGIVECDFSLVYTDDDDVELDPQPVITSEADEVAGPYHCKVVINPKKPLAASVEHTLYVIGDPDDVDQGISARTVFDVVDDPGNTGDGEMVVYGTYTRTTPDTVMVKITTAGDVGTAKYKWWYDTQGEGAAVVGQVTARRFRRLADGLQIRFAGSGFDVDDLFEFNVEAIERMATSTQVTFTTNDGSYSDAPDSPSTPAESEPPLVPIPGSSTDTFLEVVEMLPPHLGTNIEFKDGVIVITFSNDLDDATVTDDTVTVTAYPVSGIYEDTNQPIELSKKLTVVGNQLTIEL